MGRKWERGVNEGAQGGKNVWPSLSILLDSITTVINFKTWKVVFPSTEPSFVDLFRTNIDWSGPRSLLSMFRRVYKSFS